jgi:hypothetical protein
MFPPYQYTATNDELMIKKQMVERYKKAYSTVVDIQLMQDTGLASQMKVALQSNLVTLEALLAEASAHYSAVVGSESQDFPVGSPVREFREGYADKALAGSMKSIIIISNTIKQNVDKLAPVINYLTKADIANFLSQLGRIDDRYTDIFTTAYDVRGLLNSRRDARQIKLIDTFLEEVEKSFKPVDSALRILLNSYSPAVASVPTPSQGRQADGGYNIQQTMHTTSR